MLLLFGLFGSKWSTQSQHLSAPKNQSSPTSNCKFWTFLNPCLPNLCRGRELNTTSFFFLKLFGHPWDIPAKIPGYPAKKFGFPEFRRTCRTFWPPTPSHGRPPPPPEDIRTKKVWVWVPFFLPALWFATQWLSRKRLGSENAHKEKTRKQNFHGIVPGFWGNLIYVFFCPP